MDDKNELKIIELDMIKVRKKLCGKLSSNDELELKRKYNMLKKRQVKLLRRMN